MCLLTVSTIHPHSILSPPHVWCFLAVFPSINGILGGYYEKNFKEKIDSTTMMRAKRYLSNVSRACDSWIECWMTMGRLCKAEWSRLDISAFYIWKKKKNTKLIRYFAAYICICVYINFVITRYTITCIYISISVLRPTTQRVERTQTNSINHYSD